MKVHTGERPSACELCGETFSFAIDDRRSRNLCWSDADLPSLFMPLCLNSELKHLMVVWCEHDVDRCQILAINRISCLYEGGSVYPEGVIRRGRGHIAIRQLLAPHIHVPWWIHTNFFYKHCICLCFAWRRTFPMIGPLDVSKNCKICNTSLCPIF